MKVAGCRLNYRVLFKNSFRNFQGLNTSKNWSLEELICKFSLCLAYD